MKNIKNWQKFNESNDDKCFDMLSQDDIENIINDDNLDSAMRKAQDKIGQTDGGVCGIYWSGYDDREKGIMASDLWEDMSADERLNHLKKYLELEDIYRNA